jgi:hypothetical protein
MLSLSPRARFAAGAPLALKRLWDPLAAYMANGFDRAPLPGPGDPERRTGERVRAAADTNGEAAVAKASNPVRLAGVGLAARCTGELGTVLGGELGREEDMVNGGAAFEVGGGVAIVFVIVIVELFVRVDEEPKRLGPLTDAKGDSRDAYEAKPPPPCAY